MKPNQENGRIFTLMFACNDNIYSPCWNGVVYLLMGLSLSDENQIFAIRRFWCIVRYIKNGRSNFKLILCYLPNIRTYTKFHSTRHIRLTMRPHVDGMLA